MVCHAHFRTGLTERDQLVIVRRCILDVVIGLHEGTGAHNSHINVFHGGIYFYRHVASHWEETRQALIAILIAGVFELYLTPSVGYLEARAFSPESNGTIRSNWTTTRRICH